MKNGSTHLAHKSEHAVDMDSGAATLHGGAEADNHKFFETMKSTGEKAVTLGQDVLLEWAGDRGYHSNETLQMFDELRLRGYISEPDRGRRK